MKRLLYYLILPYLVLLSCNKNVSPSTNKRLQKIHMHGARGDDDSASITMFYYDQMGVLSKIVDSVPHSSAHGVTHLSYNSSGKLSVATIDPNPYLVMGTDSFFYENTGQVQKVVSRRKYFEPVLNDIFNYVAKHFLAYDASGKLIADTTYQYFSNDSSVDYVRYNYGNDDLTSWEKYVLRQGIFTSVGIDYATYDNGTNPYSVLGLNYYFLRNDNTVLSAHMRKILQRYWGGPVDYTYEYNPDGLVKRIVLDGIPTKPYITYIDFYYD